MPEQPTNDLTDVVFDPMGSYLTEFLHLKLGITCDIKQFSLLWDPQPPYWTHLFLHEYVHFLQGVTTTFGLWQFIAAADYIGAVSANTVVENGQPTEDSSQTGVSDTTLDNNTLMGLYKGQPKPRYDLQEGFQFVRMIPKDGPPIGTAESHFTTTDFVVEYTISVDGDVEPLDIKFGGVHLEEYVAHAIQHQFDASSCEQHKVIPYTLVEHIVRAEVPGLVEDDSNPQLRLIALCDACLMVYQPAHLFFDTVNRMKRDPNLIPATVDAVYEFVLDSVKLDVGGVKRRPEELFEMAAKTALDKFRDVFRSAPATTHVVEWFEEVILQAQRLRLQRRSFMTKLVAGHKALAPMFGKISHVLGIPFTTNLNHQGFFDPPCRLTHLDIHPFFPKVLQAIKQVIVNKSQSCSLHDFCKRRDEEKNNLPPITCSSCLNAPWTRSTANGYCPFTAVWHSLGIRSR